VKEKPRSDLLIQADHFYFCAEYMRGEAANISRMAEVLATTADRLCEHNMKQTERPPAPAHCPTCKCKATP
jgi:hypothetical protein